MTRDEANRELERRFKERYPRSLVTVTAATDQVTVAVARSLDDSFEVVVNPDWHERGSAILTMMLARRDH